MSPDTENWQPWQSVPDFSRGHYEPASASLPRFVQFAAEFVPGQASGVVRLDYVQFGVTQPPMASEALAEITPHRAAFGTPVRFTCKIRTVIAGGDRGFDSISIETPVAPERIDGVRIGNAELAQVGLSAGVEEGEFAVGPYADGSFTVRLPRLSLLQSGELIEIDFWNEIFAAGTSFGVSLFDSGSPREVRQQAVPGDVDPRFDSNSLTVRPVSVAAKTVHALRLRPIVFTPNGDGANDVLIIEYDLVNLTGGAPVALVVFDLAGRRVAEIPAATGTSGRFSTSWDGRGFAARLVPPGIYVVRLEVSADRNTATAAASVRVAY